VLPIGLLPLLPTLLLSSMLVSGGTGSNALTFLLLAPGLLLWCWSLSLAAALRAAPSMTGGKLPTRPRWWYLCW